MFGSDILEVAIGLVFTFLAISLFVSAAVEGINSGLKTRARNLKTGIMALVNDPSFDKLAKDLYQHALISPLGPGKPEANVDADQSAKAYGKWKNLPSYIDKQQFARAFLDVTKLSEASAQSAEQLKTQIDAIQNPQIKLCFFRAPSIGSAQTFRRLKLRLLIGSIAAWTGSAEHSNAEPSSRHF